MPSTRTPSPADLAVASAPFTQPAPPPHDEMSGARQWLLGLSLLLIAFNLRPVFGSLSVVLPEIMRDTGLSATGASLLTTLPVFCLGLFAAPAPALARRFGMERALLGALLLICVGTLLRLSGNLPLLFLSSALAGIGIAVGNVLLPGLVKRDFPNHSAMMTGLYTLTICAGASAATAFTVPLEKNLFQGAWAPALASWALPAAVVMLLWLPFAFSTQHRPAVTGTKAGSLWRDRLAWEVTGFMGLQSSLAYIVMSWLAPILRERGLDSTAAGYVVAASIMTQLLTCLITPPIAARCKDQRGLAVGMAVLILASMLALIFAPLSGRWVWAVLLGLGQGGSFALALSLIVMRSANAQVTAQLSAMAQGWGYVVAACGPLLVGLLRGWTGGFQSAALLLVVITVGMAWCGWGAGRALVVQPITR